MSSHQQTLSARQLEKLHKKRLDVLKKKLSQKEKRSVGKKHKMPFDEASDDDDDLDEILGNDGHKSTKDYFDSKTEAAEDWFEDEAYIQFDKKTRNNEEIQVEFDVAAPDFDKDFDGVQLYARNILHGQSFNTAEFSELILGDEQSKVINTCTSVLKIYSGSDEAAAAVAAPAPKQPAKAQQNDSDDDDEEDEEESADPWNGDTVDTSQWEWNDIYGVVSCVDLFRNKDKQCVKQILQYVLDNCKDVKLKTMIKEVLMTTKVGLLVNERVMNLPLEIAPVLHDNLHTEVGEAMKDGDMSVFQNYLVISKVFYESAMEAEKTDRMASDILDQKARKKRRTDQDTIGDTKDLNDTQKAYLQNKSKMMPSFYKAEEEFYFEKAKFKFTFPIINQATQESSAVAMDSVVETEGIVMIVEREKVPKILKKIRQMFSNDPNAQQDADSDDEAATGAAAAAPKKQHKGDKPHKHGHVHGHDHGKKK